MRFPKFILTYLTFVLLLCGAQLSGQSIHSCTVIHQDASAAAMPSNLPAGVQKAVSYKPNNSYSTFWANGSTITVRFLGGSSDLQHRVMTYAREWTRHANVDFRVVNYGNADIRVSFTQNGASWSMVGNSSARASQSRASMNFGWLTDRTPDYEVKRTVLHEFGHALGLLHEHQNPAGGIPWDEEAVYNHYYRTQGWDRKTTYDQVMATARRDATQFSAYDQASIMHYPVDARLTGGRYEVGMNRELSATDKAYIARMYPGRSSATTTTSTPERPRTSPTRPAPRETRPTPTVATRSHTVRISNQLGQSQKKETVELTVGDRRYVIRLDRNGRTRQALDLRLPPGRHRYRVVTSSTYFGYRNVRDPNGNVRRQYVESDVPGSGEGYLTVNGNTDLTLYGQYDRANRRMKVYLGASK